ncbi:MAG: recombinase family protein [Bacteroidales bacterium]|nr:recombinase family protein [Bacteroidales bacterium]
MKRAVIYARVSSTTDRQSTDRQVIDLKEYAKRNDLDMVKVFQEHISGAKKNNERPVLRECIEFAEENEIDIILCSELSRLGRNCDEVLKNVLHCKEVRLNLFFQKENLFLFQEDGTENPYSNIMIAVLGTAAQLERDNIKFRLNSGRAKYIAEGGKLGRSKGSVKSAEQLASEYANVVKELKRGTSIRRTAKLCDVNSSTVQKVKKVLGIGHCKSSQAGDN